MTDENIHVKWMDEEIFSYSDAVKEMLLFFDETLEQKGWDEPPILGAVVGSQMGDQASLSVECPEMPNEFWEHVETALPQLALQCFYSEIENDPTGQDFLNTGISGGFQGWVFSAEFEGYEVDQDGGRGERVEHRLTVYSDIENHRYAVNRTRGEDKAQLVDYKTLPPQLVKALSLLTAASIMSIIRRNLDKNPEE